MMLQPLIRTRRPFRWGRGAQCRLGGAEVSRLGMPCLASSNETNNQATARSRHTGGVHVLMLDGSGHFVSDTVNLDIWHRIHKRNNKEVFELPF